MPSRNSQKPTDRRNHAIRAQRLFTMIAPVYDLVLARSMTRLYRKAVDLLLQTNLHTPGSGPTPPGLSAPPGLWTPPGLPTPGPPAPELPILSPPCVQQPCAPHPATTALDVGTGTGLLASELAKAGFRVTATDSCGAMLRVAQRHRPCAARYIQAEAHLASRQPQNH